jgi:hypothetical protein
MVGGSVQAGVGGQVAAEAAVGPVQGDPQPVILDPGDQPATEHGQQDQRDDPQPKLRAAGAGGGLVDTEQPARQRLDTGPEGNHGRDGAGAGQQGDGHIGGVVGADGDPTQRDQERGPDGDQAPAAREEQAAGRGGGGDGGVVGEERAVAGPAADGIDGGERPVGAGPEVEVAGRAG